MTNAAHPPIPENATPAARIRMATFRLARRLRAHRAIDSMSDAQFNVLAVLSMYGDHTLSELADRDRISAPSMTRTVNGLEELGFVTRTADADDRRKVNISLTDAGRAVVTDTVRKRDAWLDDGFGELSQAERDILLQAAPIMRKLADR
ncbi:MarR family winged helix-turn-helix transcriptional regulator [Microbacterium sp. YY-03]|uniref:MarR family winged helix-turn-helix transcriptional regulator n=1 Tax=Microbacterium sp. YY-03 TaxID=3421636 RepID=UPI003D1784D5